MHFKDYYELVYSINEETNKCSYTQNGFVLTWIKLVIIVKGNLKAPFSIATTQRCIERHYSFP